MNPQTQALAVNLLRQGKPLGEIADATGLMDREVVAIAKQVSMQVGTAAARPGPVTPREAMRGPHAVNIPVPSPLARLLEDASGHSASRVRKLGEKIEADLDRLREVIAEHADSERTKRAAIEAKAKARAEVERLEHELADAKARLRGKKPVVAKSGEAGPAAPTEPKTCVDCGQPIVREPGQMGATPRKCSACRTAA